MHTRKSYYRKLPPFSYKRINTAGHCLLTDYCVLTFNKGCKLQNKSQKSGRTKLQKLPSCPFMKWMHGQFKKGKNTYIQTPTIKNTTL
jgi:hypothetical protein